jgi:hypothetical protein
LTPSQSGPNASFGLQPPSAHYKRITATVGALTAGTQAGEGQVDVGLSPVDVSHVNFSNTDARRH